ncbi:hypothetical protein [Bartonella sp. WD16.2]|uniref:hypothetical protein n=1 Tax=Bartonella sp. WD16.2 TaxID=1933904 RepID=UPI001885E46D|nr:hypothetical protein [Bartonella sp. WD16.2]
MSSQSGDAKRSKSVSYPQLAHKQKNIIMTKLIIIAVSNNDLSSADMYAKP